MQEQILFNFDAVQHGAALAPTRTCCAASSFDVKSYRKQYYQINRERLIIAQRARYAANPEKMRANARAYRASDREKIRAISRANYQRNKQKIRASAKERYQKNRAAEREKQKVYRLENRERILTARSKKEKELRAKNPSYRKSVHLRSRLSEILRSRVERELGLTGCSLSFLRKWLENKFKPGMSWENYGKFGWHIDHIRPCSSFDLSKPEEQAACFHYTNLQPLWACENLSKSDKVITSAKRRAGW